MKQQITRLSPHQNAKVSAILMAVFSLVVMLPFFLITAPFDTSPNRVPVGIFLLLPILYLIATYIMTIITCALYNLVAQYTGGIEFRLESRDEMS